VSPRAATLVEKIWNRHVVVEDGGELLLHVDRAFIHEGASHAFDKLAEQGRSGRAAQAGLRVHRSLRADDRPRAKASRASRTPRSATWCCSCMPIRAKHGIRCSASTIPDQGILHIVPPEQGITQPGLLICGADSHTSTHGAFGCIAFGIGASEMMHVMPHKPSGNAGRNPCASRSTANWASGSPKDIILAIIAKIGVDGGTGHVVEYAGSTLRTMSMEGRMTVCNMSIEAGARAGMVAPDETTYAYLEGRPYAPKGAQWDEAVASWRQLPSDEGARYDREVALDAADRPDGDLGDQPRPGRPGDRPSCPIRARSRMPSSPGSSFGHRLSWG
jgi:3-isopropylmalate/(R)-2-methylmalate dehydratase large subunit